MPPRTLVDSGVEVDRSGVNPTPLARSFRSRQVYRSVLGPSSLDKDHSQQMCALLAGHGVSSGYHAYIKEKEEAASRWRTRRTRTRAENAETEPINHYPVGTETPSKIINKSEEKAASRRVTFEEHGGDPSLAQTGGGLGKKGTWTDRTMYAAKASSTPRLNFDRAIFRASTKVRPVGRIQAKTQGFRAKRGRSDENKGYTVSNKKVENEDGKVGPRMVSEDLYFGLDESIGSCGFDFDADVDSRSSDSDGSVDSESFELKCQECDAMEG